MTSELHKRLQQKEVETEKRVIEEIVKQYGDLRLCNKHGRTLRFYLLPHFKHKEGDDKEKA